MDLRPVRGRVKNGRSAHRARTGGTHFVSGAPAVPPQGPAGDVPHPTGSVLARPEGFEPPTRCLEGSRSVPSATGASRSWSHFQTPPPSRQPDWQRALVPRFSCAPSPGGKDLGRRRPPRGWADRVGRPRRPPYPILCIHKRDTAIVPTKRAATATAAGPLTSTGFRSHPMDRPSRVYTRFSSALLLTRQ